MESIPSGSLFKNCRLIAACCKDPQRRDNLRAAVDDCKEVFDRFAISACQDDMEQLVARWTKMLLAMEACGPMGEDPGSRGGKLHAPSRALTRDPLLDAAVNKLTGTQG